MIKEKGLDDEYDVIYHMNVPAIAYAALEDEWMVLDFGAPSCITSYATARVMRLQHPQHCQTLVPYGANIHIATSTIPILNSLNHLLSIFPQHGKVINVTSLNVYGQGTISRTAEADGAISNRLCSDITPCVHRPLRKAVEEPPSTRPNLWSLRHS